MADILVIHQEHYTSTRIYKFLREEGHKVACAESREETLSIIDELRFDLALIDSTLDDSNGSATFQELQARNSTMEGILICREPDIRTAIDSIRGGIRDYLSLPIEKDLLIRAVTRVLRNKKMQDLHRRLTDENLLYQNHLEQMIAAKTDSLNTIIEQTIQNQDREKTDLAHTIFDNITQPLSSLLQRGEGLETPSRERITGALQEAMDNSRAMVSRLNPLQLQPLGIEEAVRQAARTLCRDSNPEVSLSRTESFLEGGWDLNIYRIIEDLVSAFCNPETRPGVDDRDSDEGTIRIRISGGNADIGIRDTPAATTARERIRLLQGTLEEESGQISISIPGPRRTITR